MRTLRKLFVLVGCSAVSCLVGCGGGSSSTPPNVVATTGNNVAPITVNGGPLGTGVYPDAAFISVTVCVPGSSTECQTVPGILVDTGSIGLRILSSSLPGGLSAESSGSNPVLECYPTESGYFWGPVETADVQIGSETASSVPIQAIGSSDAVPQGCLDFGVPSSNTQQSLGANGIIGVGVFPQDCGPGCPADSNLYYECSSATSCTGMAPSLTQQVQNPISMFPTDNNGVIVELPQVQGGVEASVSGSLVFGIGTQSNNGLSGATVYTVDPSTGNFTTTFNGTTYTDESFLDSGSNAYFFADSSIPDCTVNSGYYCPSSTVNLSATNQGVANQGAATGSGTVNFSIANADNLFNEYPTDNAFSDLGVDASAVGASNLFDWGLPFFFNRNVYVAIDGATAPGGTTPYWAY
ncbi:MAG: DUF3443 family protein [Candidatus Sulfotelmatobacter sp.]